MWVSSGAQSMALGSWEKKAVSFIRGWGSKIILKLWGSTKTFPKVLGDKKILLNFFRRRSQKMNSEFPKNQLKKQLNPCARKKWKTP